MIHNSLLLSSSSCFLAKERGLAPTYLFINIKHLRISAPEQILLGGSKKLHSRESQLYQTFLPCYLKGKKTPSNRTIKTGVTLGFSNSNGLAMSRL